MYKGQHENYLKIRLEYSGFIGIKTHDREVTQDNSTLAQLPTIPQKIDPESLYNDLHTDTLQETQYENLSPSPEYLFRNPTYTNEIEKCKISDKVQ